MRHPPPPVEGLVAGKYEIVRLIGRGGMGSVWEGRHSSLGTRVAIKFIEPEYAQSTEARARFVTEARAAATIPSKHAIQIFDHGVTDDGRPYIVMELLVGEPLDKRLERVGTLTLQETAGIIAHVCRALQRAHDAGIIHRDLKPENIFLVSSPDDDHETSKVLDFGIAKIKPTPGEEGLTSSTKTGAVLGTPYYMSPEQARGLRNVDHRSDLWSLGVIAYKCVTGVLPFEGEGVGDLLVKICTGPLPKPSLTAPDLPSSFDRWFAQALDRDPAQRFASASELADALGTAAGLSARGAGSSYDGARAPPTGARSSAVVSATGATRLPFAGETSAPFTSSAMPSTPSRGMLLAVAAAALIGGSVGVVAVVKLASPKTVPDATAPGTARASPASPAEIEPSGEPSPNGAAAPPPGSAAPETQRHAAPTSSTAGTKVQTRLKASTPEVSAKLPMPPPKPPPNTADPGY